MTISIDAKPLEIKAELKGYGIFYLRHLGAGAEAETLEKIKLAKEKTEECAKKHKAITDKESSLVDAKDEKALEELRATAEYKKAMEEKAEVDAIMQDTNNYINKCMLNLWRSDDPKAMERLLSDFSTEQIRGFYAQVMTEANNG